MQDFNQASAWRKGVCHWGGGGGGGGHAASLGCSLGLLFHRVFDRLSYYLDRSAIRALRRTRRHCTVVTFLFNLITALASDLFKIIHDWEVKFSTDYLKYGFCNKVISERWNSDKLNTFTTYLSSLLGVIAIVFRNHAQKWGQICCKSVKLVKVSSFRNDFVTKSIL